MSKASVIGLVAALAGSGCSTAQNCPGPSFGPMVTGPVSDQVGHAGEPMTLQVAAAAVLKCPEGFTQPSGVTAVVTDWRAHKIGSSGTFLRVLDGAMQASVQFTPPQPGLYNVTVRFEPDVGLLQTLVNVAEDHRDAGHQSFAVDRQCDQLALVGGRLLCNSQGYLTVITNGAGGATFQANAWWPTSTGAWVLDQSAYLSHLEDDGGLFVTGFAPTGLFSPFLFATDDRVLLFSSVYLEVSNDGGALEPGIAQPAQHAGSFVQWIPGEQFVFISTDAPAICQQRFDGGSSCGTQPGGAIGQSSQGIWFTNASTLGVVHLDGDGGLRETRGAWNGGLFAAPTPGPLVAPILLINDGHAFLPHLEPAEDQVVLEDYGLLPSPPIGADEQCLWYGQAGQVTCIQRR